MAHPIVILADPGIDGAFAIALALADPDVDVLGIAATPGNVSATQATENVRIIIEQLDPPRWPRLGEAPPVEYEVDGAALHGPGGLGGVHFPVATRHHPLASEKLLGDVIRSHPQEVTVVALGPLTVLAETLVRNPELPKLVRRIVSLGGSWHEPGNATAVAEFHFYCDPPAARRVLRSGAPITLLPLDVARKVLFSPTDLLELPAPESRTCRFLRQIVPHGIRATSNLYGIEGFHLKDVLGIIALTVPGAITTRSMHVDVETQGELTRGMSVVDARTQPGGKPNVELGIGVDVGAVRQYITRILQRAK
jgi:inosine-uridine nucleoside N-ribohydrolase